MSDISRAFQLCQNGAEAELASMLQSRSIDAAACQTTGRCSGWSCLCFYGLAALVASKIYALSNQF